MSGRGPRWIQKISRGTTLGDIELGTLVKLNVSGTPENFYVACHNYESGLNGNGLTLLVKKICAANIAFSASLNTYANENLDSYLNDEFLQCFDSGIIGKIVSTKFYYTPGGTDKDVVVLQRKVFQPSSTEFGFSAYNTNTEGTALPIAETLRGIETAQWTRTPYLANNKYVISITDYGAARYNTNPTERLGSRPSLALPADTIVGEDMLIV